MTDRDRGERPGPERIRVIGFSDAVFAISITLLVLEISPPEDTRHLFQGLLDLWPSYTAYAVTFLFIGQVWVNHHVIFNHIRPVGRALLFLNTMLLMAVAFFPFAASVLAAAFRDDEGESVAVIFYGAAVGVGTLLFNLLWEYARYHHRRLGSTIDAAGARKLSRRFWLAPVVTLAGTLVGALVPAVGLAVFAALVPIFWLPIWRGDLLVEEPE
ncbi:TMEM175 family protein [Micromonospora sp. WMMD812]|uniref:TMEM175 family protein n=1 Tax=Micromonospora sp. WMMD812 TaxID=3015152 RepID=UPI00248D263E|nr:TMEM175 family protein [Micromonospora sp. WMMD812]WBB69938.1 TMEM175 family protein [Micromonospora sp. WMMD812]